MYMILYFTTPFKMIITFYTVNQILKYIIYTVYKNVYIYISIHRFFLKCTLSFFMYTLIIIIIIIYTKK